MSHRNHQIAKLHASQRRLRTTMLGFVVGGGALAIGIGAAEGVGHAEDWVAKNTHTLGIGFMAAGGLPLLLSERYRRSPTRIITSFVLAAAGCWLTVEASNDAYNHENSPVTTAPNTSTTFTTGRKGETLHVLLPPIVSQYGCQNKTYTIPEDGSVDLAIRSTQGYSPQQMRTIYDAKPAIEQLKDVWPGQQVVIACP